MTNKPTDRIEAETARLRQEHDRRVAAAHSDPDWQPQVDEPTALAFTDFTKGEEASGRSRHDGDCSFYASLVNRCPEDGICTCGYAHDLKRLGDGSYLNEMYSKERLEAHKKAAPSDVDEDYRKGAEALAEFVADHDWGEPPVDVGEGWVETSRAKATYYRTRLPGEGWDETGWKPISGCEDCPDIIYQFRKPAGVRFGRPEDVAPITVDGMEEQ